MEIEEWRPMYGALRPCDYRCAYCGHIYKQGWTDEEAKAEAEAKGVDTNHADIVCDDCYRRTPWGRVK